MRSLHQLVFLGLFGGLSAIASGQNPAHHCLVGCESDDRSSLQFRPELMEAAFDSLFTRTDSLFAQIARLQTAEPQAEPWACGDLLSYQNHSYATVAVGEQCWFAENLRSASYTNGDPILGNLDATTWSEADYGAQAIYNLDSISNFASSGRLYNWYAVADARGLCPSGWHVPSETEWQTLELHLGMDAGEVATVGLRGTNQGAQMKSSAGWNGLNSSGFNALPVGRRAVAGGFTALGSGTGFWSTTTAGLYVNNRMFSTESDQVIKGQWNKLNGLSVRCILANEDPL